MANIQEDAGILLAFLSNHPDYRVRNSIATKTAILIKAIFPNAQPKQDEISGFLSNLATGGSTLSDKITPSIFYQAFEPRYLEEIRKIQTTPQTTYPKYQDFKTIPPNKQAITLPTNLFKNIPTKTLKKFFKNVFLKIKNKTYLGIIALKLFFTKKRVGGNPQTEEQKQKAQSSGSIPSYQTEATIYTKEQQKEDKVAERTITLPESEYVVHQEQQPTTQSQPPIYTSEPKKEEEQFKQQPSFSAPVKNYLRRGFSSLFKKGVQKLSLGIKMLARNFIGYIGSAVSFVGSIGSGILTAATSIAGAPVAGTIALIAVIIIIAIIILALLLGISSHQKHIPSVGIQSEYIGVQVDVSPKTAFSNDEIASSPVTPIPITYTITVTAKKEKVDLKDVHVEAVLSKNGQTVKTDQFSSPKILAGENEKGFVNTTTFNLTPDDKDSILTQVVSVSAAVSEQEQPVKATNITNVIIGSPALACPDGQWPTTSGYIIEGPLEGTHDYKGYKAEAIDIGHGTVGGKDTGAHMGDTILSRSTGTVVDAHDGCEKGHGPGYDEKTNTYYDGDNCGNYYGNHVKVQTLCKTLSGDEKQIVVIYAHMLKGTVLVANGNTVYPNEELGKLGASGNATGPHLHYEFTGGILMGLPYIPAPREILHEGLFYWTNTSSYSLNK